MVRGIGRFHSFPMSDDEIITKEKVANFYLTDNYKFRDRQDRNGDHHLQYYFYGDWNYDMIHSHNNVTFEHGGLITTIQHLHSLIQKQEETIKKQEERIGALEASQ